MPITFLDDKKEQPGNGITFLDNAGNAGISFLDEGRNATGEEVTNRQASNPASAELMNRDDYVRMLEYKRDNPVSWGTIAMQGAEGLIDVAGGAIKEIGGATVDAFNAPAPKGSISQLGVADLSRLNPVGEAAARGAYAGFNQLAGMALDMMTWNDDDLISYPQYLSANNLSDSAENKQKHELELNKQFEEFKRSQFAKAQTKDILEKSPLPATSEAVSLFAQPEFGIGALMGMGAKLRVGRAAAEAGSVVGEATQKLGKGLTTLSEMPKKLAVATAEELTGNPRVASRVGSAVQTGTTGAVIAGMGGFAIPGVYEASKLITATKIAGEVLDVVGEVTKKISESAKAGTGRIGAFEALSQDLGASSSARTIGKIATLGGVDSITPYMSAALQGAASGAVVGGTLGFLADGGEGMAAGVGMGLTLGAGGGLAGRGLQVASGAQRRSQIINDATKGVLNLSEASKGNAAKLFDSLIRRDGQEAVAELIDTTKWLNGAVKFEYITNEQAKSMPEAIGVGFEGITVAPKKGDVGTPTVFINIDRVNPGTGFHEGFHGAMRTALGDVYAPKFNELISKSFSQKEIDDFVSGYINRAENPAVKDVLKSYLEKKGNLPEEIGAEYFRQFLQQKENRDILLRGQRTTSGALINATKSAIDFSLNRLGVTQESYKTGYRGMDRLVTELIGARTAINKSIAKNGVPLAEVPLMKMPAQEVAVWAKTQGQSDVLLKDDAGNVIGVKTEDQVNLQRDLANSKAAADLADVPRGKNNLTDAELAVYQKYLPPEHFARLVYIVDAIKTGKVINGDYFPATSKEGETSVYASRGMTTRDFVPYGIKVSKAGAISVMGLDMTQLRARFDDYMSRPGVDKLWDGNRDAALMDVQRYAENLSKGDAAVPSEQLFGKNKRDVLYKIFGFAPTKAILKSGGLVNPSSLGTNVRAESSAGPMQIGKPIDAYSNDTRLTTSFRLDRLGRVSDIGQSFQFNEGGSYKLSQVNFQVAEKIGSGEVWRSKDDQYKIIVKGNKHIVYNGNDKIGIFGNIADASSKIHKVQDLKQKNNWGLDDRTYQNLRQSASDVRFLPIDKQPENAPVAGRLTEGQAQSVKELSEFYRAVTPARIPVLENDAIESLSARLINKGVPVADAQRLALETFNRVKGHVTESAQVISGIGASDIARMGGTGRPAVETKETVNPVWLTSAFEAFRNDNDLAMMKAQQVAKQLNKEQQATAMTGKLAKDAVASSKRASTIEQGTEFLVGEMNADKKAFGSSLRDDANAVPRVYASVVEGQKFGSQGNYNVFFEWDKSSPMVITSHHHYGVGNGLTGIHASANVGDKNARSFGNVTNENYIPLPSGKKVLDTPLLVGNDGINSIRAHQLVVSIPESALSKISSLAKTNNIEGISKTLESVAYSQLVGSNSQGKTQAFTSSEGVGPKVAIQRNRTEAYVLNPDLANVRRVTIVSNKPEEIRILTKNINNAFKNNGAKTPEITVVSAESGPSSNVGRAAITENYRRMTGKVAFMPADSAAPESKFYSSRIISAVENSSQGKANGSQWKATIKNSKLGVNQDEYALTRVEDLEAGKTYTKAEVLDYLRANEVVVKDVTLGGVPDGVEAKRKEIEAKIDDSTLVTDAMKAGYNQLDAVNLPWRIREGRTNISSLPDSILDEAKRVDALWKEWDGLDKSVSNQTTHFSEYTLPGAKEGSYREVLLTVPATPKISRSREMTLGDIPAGATTQEFLALRGRALAGEKLKYTEEGETWRDGHSQYDNIPNPIVRLRTNERTIITYTPEQIADIGRRLVSAIGANSENSLGSSAPQFGVNKGAITPLEAAQYSHAKKYTSGVDQKGAVKRMLFIEEIQAPQKGQFEKMPALFQKNWRDIAFKWALRTAADNGFDSIGWTTGEQQAARYDLSKQIDKLYWYPSEDGKGTLIASSKEQGDIINKQIAANEIGDYVGKEIAKRLLDAKPTAASQARAEQMTKGGAKDVPHRLSGVDLKIGGEGLKKLYDLDFRNVVNNLPVVKKSGQKVGMVEIVTQDQKMVESPINVGEPTFERSQLTTPVHAINVTPEMRNASVSFMPSMQFSAAENLPNGKVWRGENGYAIMQKEGGKFRVHSPIGLIGIAASYEAAEKMASKRNNK